MTNEEAIKVLNMVEAHGHLVIQAKEMAIKALSVPEREKGTKYYKADDVIKVLHDNGYEDEENGADPEYMTALSDVRRGLDNISTYAVPEREKGTNGEIIKAIFPEGNEFDIKKYQYKAWTAKNKSDFSVEMSVEFWNAEYKGSFAVPERDKREWIPVTKRLPEEPYACWVTVWDTNILTQEEFENVLPYPIGYDGETWNDGDGNICPFEVIAWMPAPEPYKAESEG